MNCKPKKDKKSLASAKPTVSSAQPALDEKPLRFSVSNDEDSYQKSLTLLRQRHLKLGQLIIAHFTF